MKKFLLSAIALLGLASVAYAGDGSKDNPYTVDDVLALFKADANVTQENKYVQGYIVGSIPASAESTVLSAATFTSEDASNTNLVLGGSSAEDDASYCMAIQLPSGNVRNGLSLAQNPKNLGHEVLLCGTIKKYCGGPGLQATSSYDWIGEAPEAGGADTSKYAKGTPEAPLTVTEFLAQGTPNAPVAGTYVTGYIVGYIATQGSNVYTYNATDAEATNILIAAAADVTTDADVIPVQLPQGDVRSALNLKDNAGNLGKQVTLYGSHEAYFNANGLKSVTHYWWGGKGETVNETPNNPGTGNQPTAPTGEISVAQALEYINAGGESTIRVKGYITSITTKEENFEQYHDQDYYISDDVNASNELYVYNGDYLNGAKFTSMDQIKVGDLVVVEGKCKLYNGTPEIDRGSKIISLNGETAGSDEPSGPSVEVKGLEQPFTTGLGFPEGKTAEVPTEVTTITASDTGIEYNLLGCNVNSGNYLMMSGKTVEGAYISWTLDFPMSRLALVTTSGCSENPQSQVNIYAGETLIQGAMAVNAHDATYLIEIPEACQAPGTVYKVESNTTKYNQQFAKFIYVNANEDGVDAIVADDSEAVYYNLQGQKVANPDKGIFIKVVGNKAVKVLK